MLSYFSMNTSLIFFLTSCMLKCLIKETRRSPTRHHLHLLISHQFFYHFLSTILFFQYQRHHFLPRTFPPRKSSSAVSFSLFRGRALQGNTRIKYCGVCSHLPWRLYDAWLTVMKEESWAWDNGRPHPHRQARLTLIPRPLASVTAAGNIHINKAETEPTSDNRR